MTSKTLIIYAHPHTKGHNGVILENVKRLLKQRGEKTTIIDLYKTQFNPVLSADELSTKYNTFVSKQTTRFQDLIKQSTHIIFIYPTWWQNVPAILKGFIDKIFRDGFSADFSKRIPTPLLKGKRAVLITTVGESKFVARCIFNSRSIKVLKKDVLELCGIRTKGFIITNAKKLDLKQKTRLKNYSLRAVNWLYK
jgi:NAD(P)H dehydrogenase (quinone)